MFDIPTPVIRFGRKAGAWLVKNGPNIMRVGGGLMAVGGAVMACNATLRADEVLEAHKARMAQIEAARKATIELAEAGDLNPDMAYTEEQMKRDKFIAYSETAVGFIKLYGPAVAIGLSGVGLMQAAYTIVDNRRATAVAALTSLDNMFNQYKARVEGAIGPDEARLLEMPESEKVKVKLPDSEEEEEVDAVVIDDDNIDETSFWYDETCDGWQRGNAFLYNGRMIDVVLERFKKDLSAHVVDYVFINDILRRLEDVKDCRGIHCNSTNFGTFFGYGEGDVIDYEIIPYEIMYAEAEDGRFPMYVEIDEDQLEAYELRDIQKDYCFEIRFYGARNIYKEVYGLE